MYKLAVCVQIIDMRSQKIARINKKLSLASISFPRGLSDENLVNSRYNYGAVAQKKEKLRKER